MEIFRTLADLSGFENFDRSLKRSKIFSYTGVTFDSDVCDRMIGKANDRSRKIIDALLSDDEIRTYEGAISNEPPPIFRGDGFGRECFNALAP